MDEIEIHYFVEEPIRADVLIEGLPGIGQVGKLVAEHIISEVDASLVAEIYSYYFPPQVIIGPDGVCRMANNQIYQANINGKDYLFLVGDFQSTSAEGHYALTSCYLDIIAEAGVSRIYTLGGYGVGHMVERPRVLAAVNQPHLRAEVEAAGGQFPGEDEAGGGIVGASGLLLGMGALMGLEGICLMGETAGYLVDPRSAHCLLEVLCSLTGMEIDLTSLQERGEEMERVLARLKEAESTSEDELRYIG
ncbi:MAG: proteasome assembly chaperone family protein [Methanoculleaceae archaeon]